MIDRDSDESPITDNDDKTDGSKWRKLAPFGYLVAGFWLIQIGDYLVDQAVEKLV